MKIPLQLGDREVRQDVSPSPLVPSQLLETSEAQKAAKNFWDAIQKIIFKNAPSPEASAEEVRAAVSKEIITADPDYLPAYNKLTVHLGLDRAAVEEQEVFKYLFETKKA